MRRTLFLILLVAIAAGPARAAADQQPSGLQQLTKAFADLDVRDLNGRSWKATDLEGRVVLVDFWATWCAPCLAEVPWLREASKRFPADRFAILGVSLDTGDRRTLTAWLNRNRVDWPQIWDDRGYNGGLARRFGIVSLPQSLLVDAHGNVVATNLRGKRLIERIDAMLK